MMRIVVLTSLMTAMVRCVASGPYSGKGTGEGALFRKIAEEIPAGSVVVGDRYYCAYFTIAMLQSKGIDVVTRLTTNRLEQLGKRDTFQRLKNGDLQVIWQRPARPDWMTLEEYDAMPETLTLRLCEVRVEEKGFRVKHLWVLTTLMDTELDSRESLSDLYRQRWHVELDLNAIKTMMGLDVLRGKTPHMLRLELLVGILAYNLVRLMMFQTAALKGMSPRGLSFTSASSTMLCGWASVFGMGEAMYVAFVNEGLRELSKHRAGHRGGRVEPRAVKRRPKAYPRMKQPRDILRAKLIAEPTGKQ
jgi:hypothetical protein